MTWQQPNPVQKRGGRPDWKDTFFLFHGLDFPWPKEGQRNAEAQITQYIGFSSTLLPLCNSRINFICPFCNILRNSLKIEALLKIRMVCRLFFVDFCFGLLFIYLLKSLSNRNPWFAVRNQSTYLFWLKRRFLSKVEKKNETCLEKWVTTVTTFP